MEPIHTPKKPVDPPTSDTPDDVVHALLAEADLPQKKSPRKNSRRSCKKSKGSAKRTKKQSRKPKPPPKSKDELHARIESQFDFDVTDADQRLREFMLQARTLHERDGTESLYEPNENRSYTLEEIGTVMGVTRERVRQIEEAALRKLWRRIRSINMREDLEETDWINVLTDYKSDDPTVYYPDSV